MIKQHHFDILKQRIEEPRHKTKTTHPNIVRQVADLFLKMTIHPLHIEQKTHSSSY